MKSLSLLACFMCAAVNAETIQNIEYNLPKAATHWIVGNKMENEKGSTIIYIPQGTIRIKAEEFFGVSANDKTTDISDTYSIKSKLMEMFPNMQIDFQALETSDDSLIYEWSAQKNGTEKVHGWSRVFSHPNGTITLLYQTSKIADVSRARSIWLPALKSARPN